MAAGSYFVILCVDCLKSNTVIENTHAYYNVEKYLGG